MKAVFLRITALFLVLCLLAGCGGAASSSKSTSQNSASKNTVSATPVPTAAPAEGPYAETVTLSEEALAAYCDAVRETKTAYPFEELYNVDAALAICAPVPQPEAGTLTFIRNGAVDREAFNAQVLQNTETYFAGTPDRRYSQLPEKELHFFLDAIADMLDFLIGLDAQTPGELAELDRVLGQLKLAEGTQSISTTAAVAFDELVMGFDLKVMDALQEHNPDIDVYYQTACHETVHLAQVSLLPGRPEKEDEIASFRFTLLAEELDVNPLDLVWFCEGSADFFAHHFCGGEPLAYPYYARLLEGLALALVPNDDAAVYALAGLSLTSDPAALFTLLGAETEAGQREVLSMLCAARISYGGREPIFYELCEQAGGEKLQNDNNFRASMRAGVAITETKIFYRNLARRAARGMTLREIFSLCTAFEQEMCRFTLYHSYIEQAKPFVTAYSQIQRDFFALLAGGCSLDADALASLYSEYYRGKEAHIADAASLEAGEAGFVQHILDTRRYSRPAICAAYPAE